MEIFLNYLKDRRRIIGLALLFCAIFLSAFALYHLPIGAVLTRHVYVFSFGNNIYFV